MIILSDYWMGRDKEYASELTPTIIANAMETIRRANLLLTVFRTMTGDVENRHVTSGWRPAAINLATPGAARRSRHLTGQAVDIFDPEGDFDEWCLAHPEYLVAAWLWLEHPSATKGWSHCQTVPPRSGNRVFYP